MVATLLHAPCTQKYPVLCTYQYVTSTCPPQAIPRAFEFFDFWRSNSRPPVPKSCSNAPHVRPTGWANAPPPGHFFRRSAEEDRFKTIRYKYQMVYFKLELDKGTSYLHSKAFSSLVVYERSNSPPYATWCQIPHPRSEF